MARAGTQAGSPKWEVGTPRYSGHPCRFPGCALPEAGVDNGEVTGTQVLTWGANCQMPTHDFKTEEAKVTW